MHDFSLAYTTIFLVEEIDISKELFKFLRPRAQAQFTNREKPIESFEAALAAVQSSAIAKSKATRVLQYYGYGGIGKSRLLLEFRNRLDEEPSSHLVCDIDFDDHSVLESSRALLRIRESASADRKVRCRVFDFAYAIYFAKRNPDFSYEKAEIPYLDEGGVLGDLIGTLDGFGLVGAAAGIIELTQKYIDKFVIDESAKDALLALRHMSEREIEEALPDFLAYDLNNHAENHGIPIIVFIDTFEALWESHTSEKGRFRRDAWLRRLAECLECGLLVIAGREKLRWSELDDLWSEKIETHRLSRLSKEDVERFLKSAGIDDQELISRIQAVSFGHPYYLDLCLDTLAQEGGSSVGAWPESRVKLYDRFARSLSSAELSLLKRLAPLASYDDVYANAAAQAFNISLDVDEVKAHLRFSFIKQHKYGMSLHSLMRRSLLSRMGGDEVADARYFAFNHFDERLHKIDNKSTDREIVLPLLECARQLRFLNKGELHNDWLRKGGKTAIGILLEKASTGPILECLDNIASNIEPTTWPSYIQIAYADATHLVGRYKESVELLDEFLNSNPDPSIDSEYRTFARIRQLHHSMMFRPIENVWNDALIEVSAISNGGSQKAMGEAYFLLGGNLGAAQGLPNDAWPWLHKAHQIARVTDNSALRIRVLRKASDLYRAQGDLKRSRRLIERARKKCRQLDLRRYLNYLDCTLVDQLRLENRSDEALETLFDVRARIAQDNLDGWLGHTHLLEACIFLGLNEYRVANNSIKSALASYSRTDHLWGKLQCEMVGFLAEVRLGAVDSDRRAQDIVDRLRRAGYLKSAEDLILLVKDNSHTLPGIALL